MNNYSGQTLTVNDLDQDERGSSFDSCLFQETPEGNIIENVNFSLCEFAGCTWSTDVNKCNFRGSEGDSLPSLMKIEFDAAPPIGKIVEDSYGFLIAGDGSTTSFDVMRTDPEAVESALNDAGFDSDGFTITDGNVGPECGYGPASMSRDDFTSKTYLELTTDATDDAVPVDGVPDISADGVASCTIYIKKKSALGNYLTGSSHDDTIDLDTTRGKLSALRVDLVNGEAEITLTSVPETCIATVSAVSGEMSAEIEIQFAP